MHLWVPVTTPSYHSFSDQTKIGRPVQSVHLIYVQDKRKLNLTLCFKTQIYFQSLSAEKMTSYVSGLSFIVAEVYSIPVLD